MKSAFGHWANLEAASDGLLRGYFKAKYVELRKWRVQQKTALQV